MSNPKVYRLCFDFKDDDAMINFWEQFQAMTIQPDAEDDFRNCELVHHDALHDVNKSVREFLVRTKSNGGNGKSEQLVIDEHVTETVKGIVSK
jgi:hypothetical protein